MIQAASPHVDKIFSSVESVDTPSMLVSSWRRCVKLYGLKPQGAAQTEKKENALVMQARQRSEALSNAAAETLDHLFEALNGPDYIVFLTDADGIALDYRSSRTSDFWMRPRGDWVGLDFSEEKHGTNGIGTVLREKRPMTITPGEHFFVANLAAVCSGAPIFGPDGNLAGCIDVSASAGRNDPVLNSLILGATIEAARRIELRMLAAACPNTELLFASPTGWQAGGALAVDRDGGVVGATRAARLTLKLAPGQLNGTYTPEQLRRMETAEDLSLAAAEERAIRVALRRCNGNASAAARMLRISRSTLLRKIADFRIETA